MKTYKHPALKQLAEQQVRFAPPPRRLEQLRRTERLLAEIVADKQYPYQYVCFRITDYRPDAYPDLVISSEELTHDLGLLIAQLADSLPAIPIEDVHEPVLTLEQMSEKLHVSTRTLNRWRKQGLIGLPILCNGR
ncbi:MAG TPA: RNA polymerase subunit sigma-70, partial [Gemmataceae bacterium]|nr:RNA polymerase subunit sigma-70 [Gemmataceae bacterium]